MAALGALAITGWREHWPHAVFGVRHQAPSAQAVPASAATIRFTSDQGVILTRPGARYQLAVAVQDASSRSLPGRAVQWRSDDPAQVSVSSGGMVTAHVPAGSATITATAAGARPQAAQVLVARPAAGTVVVPTPDIMAVTTGEVTLRRTPQTEAISAGNVLVSNGRSGGGLLARVLSVTAGASTVTAVMSPASLAGAFAALSVHATSAPVTTAAAGARTAAALTAKCKLAPGATGSVSLQGPSVSVPATVRLSGVLAARSGAVQQFELAVQATLPLVVHPGSVTMSAAGTATATCELAVTSIPVPTPIFFGPVEVSGEVGQAAGLGVSLSGGASLTIPGPILSDTVTADNGIQYSSAGGWSSVDHDGQTGISVTPGPGPAARASVSATLSPFLSVGFGVAGTLAGDDLAGASLAFTRAQGDYHLDIQAPFSYLTPGYTGPRWNTSLGLTGGPEIALTGNLDTLLQWMGLTLPDKRWNLVDVTVPLQNSPSVTVTAVPGGANGKSTRLSAALPAGFNGDNVEFVQYPPQGGPGTVVAKAVVAGSAATGSWNGANPAPGTRVTALLFDPVYGAAGLPYASSASTPLGTAANTWQQQTTLADPTTGAIESIAVSLANGMLVTGHFDGSAYLWNLASSQRVATITGPVANSALTGGDIESLAFSPNGKTLAAGLGKGEIVLRGVATTTKTASFDDGYGQGGVSSLAFSPDGQMLAAGDLGSRGAFLWDVVTGNKLVLLSTKIGAITSVAFSPDGKLLAVGGDGGTVLWDVATRQIVATFGITRSGPIVSVAFSPHGTMLATSGFKGAVLWDLASGRQTAVLPDPGLAAATDSVAFSPDRAVLATAGTSTCLWDASTGKKIATINAAADSVAFGPAGQILATAAGNRVTLWAPAS